SDRSVLRRFYVLRAFHRRSGRLSRRWRTGGVLLRRLDRYGDRWRCRRRHRIGVGNDQPRSDCAEEKIGKGLSAALDPAPFATDRGAASILHLLHTFGLTKKKAWLPGAAVLKFSIFLAIPLTDFVLSCKIR